jgi:restriction system protein
MRDYSSRIVLIDGTQLAGYMIDHDVGVSIMSTYDIKKVDSDFFEEDIVDS